MYVSRWMFAKCWELLRADVVIYTTKFAWAFWVLHEKFRIRILNFLFRSALCSRFVNQMLTGHTHTILYVYSSSCFNIVISSLQFTGKCLHVGVPLTFFISLLPTVIANTVGEPRSLLLLRFIFSINGKLYINRCMIECLCSSTPLLAFCDTFSFFLIMGWKVAIRSRSLSSD